MKWSDLEVGSRVKSKASNGRNSWGTWLPDTYVYGTVGSIHGDIASVLWDNAGITTYARNGSTEHDNLNTLKPIPPKQDAVDILVREVVG